MKYEVVGGDGACNGDLIGPLIAEEIGIVNVKGLNDDKYMILKMDKKLIIKNEEIEYLTIAPRYVGVDFNDIRKKECIVGIGIIKGKFEIINNEISKEYVEYYAVGSTTPIKES